MTETLLIDCAEARSLKSCDANGWSDPFVSITLNTKKKIGQTRYIKRTLNPKWNERFKYTFRPKDGDFIMFQVYDHDEISSNDSIGQIKIEISELTDHKWADQWYRLSDPETEKPIRGYLRLRLHLVANEDNAFDLPFKRQVEVQMSRGDEEPEQQALMIAHSRPDGSKPNICRYNKNQKRFSYHINHDHHHRQDNNGQNENDENDDANE